MSGRLLRFDSPTMDMSGAHKSKIGSPGLIVSGIALAGLLLIFIEGLASFGLVLRDVMRSYPVAEQRYTKYDPDLGWVSEPNAYLPDMYGPGVYLRTNAQGFRGNQTTDAVVPHGKLRVVCSGDSFTLGFGVDDEHTWCHLLSSLDPRLETVNMGQGGYGVDQAYLRYKRDAAHIEHQVHLLAFITHDFYRMQSNFFLGYPKPMLDLENGALAVKNAPAPKREWVRWIEQRIVFLKRLQIARLLDQIYRKMRPSAPASARLSQRAKNEKTREVLREIFADLKRIAEQRSTQLVLVYLPTPGELKSGAPKDWREFLEDATKTLGIPLINLFDDFRSGPYGDIDNLFTKKGQGPYPHSGVHYSVAGNERVASRIYNDLITRPTIACAFSARYQPRSRAADNCRVLRSGS
jgi:hypothetical protein